MSCLRSHLLRCMWPCLNIHCTMELALASFRMIIPQSLFGQPLACLSAYVSIFSRGRASLPWASEAALNRGLLFIILS